MRNLARELLEDETSGGKNSIAWRPTRVAVRHGLALLGAGLRRHGAADKPFEDGALAFEGRYDRLRNLPVLSRLRRAGRVGTVLRPDPPQIPTAATVALTTEPNADTAAMVALFVSYSVIARDCTG